MIDRSDNGGPARERDASSGSEPGRIYLSPPHMGGLEERYFRDAFESNWIAPLGPHVDAFEREFAERIGVRAAAALSSGTAAIHLALRLLGVGEGDEVLVSTLTFAGSVFPILYVGATPIFVDSERRSWNLDPALVAEVLHERARSGRPPKALLPVHLYGQAADMEPLLAAAREHDIPVVEDAAEALGASYRGRSAGSLGTVGTFSFNGNKIVTTSGGGMLVSDDEGLVDRARKLASQARDAAVHYQHSEVGYNYRLSNLLAAVGRGQLRVLDDRVEKRRANFRYYEEALGDLPGVELMPDAGWGRQTRWLSCLTIDPDRAGATPEDVRLALERENIEARPLWKPMHLQPVFRDYPTIGGAVAEDLFRRGLCLPSGSDLEAADLERIVSIVRRALAEKR